MKKLLTLCLVIKDGKVLLGMKKRGFGEGRWNGFGGKVQPNESIEAAAIRETREEAGIEVRNLTEVGVLDFDFGSEQPIHEVHIFKTSEFKGSPSESEEMRPQWFTFNEIPYGQMWADDRFWLPLLLEDKKFKGYFLFGKGDAIIKQQLEEM